MFGFHKMSGISWLADELSASEEKLRPMGIIVITYIYCNISYTYIKQHFLNVLCLR
jgi:di/tricarboxylate transporter